MSIVTEVKISEQIDYTIDATDLGRKWGYDDGINRHPQSAFYFPPNSAAWCAYHEGYREGAVVDAILNGTTRCYFDPAQPHEIQMVSWNSAPTCANDYVPFQMPVEAYRDVRVAEDRDDWVGV